MSQPVPQPLSQARSRQAEPPHSDDLSTFLDRYRDAWHAGDVDAVMAMHTADTEFALHAGGVTATGSDEVRQAFQLILAAYPDLVATPVRTTVGFDHAVVESSMASASSGRSIVVDAVDVFRFRDGLIARKDTYLDSAALAG